MRLRMSFLLLTTILVLINTITITNSKLNLRKRTPVRFAARLLSALSSRKVTSQLISPYSMQSCLATVFIGSENLTAAQIHEHTEFSGNARRVATRIGGALRDIHLVNTSTIIYLSKRLNEKDASLQKWSKLLQKGFQASNVKNVDFSNRTNVAATINDVVKNVTNNRLRNLIRRRSINRNTNVILLNLIDFNAKWEKPFTEIGTETYYKDEHKTHDIKMMQQYNKFLYGRLNAFDLDAVGLVLPFENSTVYMLIILPYKKHGLDDIVKGLTNVDVSRISKYLKPTNMRVFFPMLRVNFREPVQSAVKKMGMEDAFTSKANFGDLKQNLKVEALQQETLIDANLTDVRLFAATSIQWDHMPNFALRSKSNAEEIDELELQRSYIDVDHPFFYAIINNRDVLFEGTIKNLQ